MEAPARKLVTFEDIERRLIGAHHKPYYDWLRHVISLAVAALTALVALQGYYVPEAPTAPLLLAVGWVALATTIVAGLFALRSEYATPLAAARRIRSIRASQGDAAAAAALESNAGTMPGRSHKWAVRTMITGFVVALVAVCAFAISNLPNLLSTSGSR